MKDGVRRFIIDDLFCKLYYVYVNVMGWGFDVKDLWVDVWSMDNLKLMWDMLVYFFVEEMGNEFMRFIYKEWLSDFIVMMY